MENKGMAIEGIELPKDLFMEILSRLPVKTLLRFKSVSKNWHSLLQNPTFISLHHTRARPYDCVRLSQPPKLRNPWSMHLLPDQTSIHDLDLSFTRPHLNTDFIHHGSCKGLMCLSEQSNIMICNPATREYRLLPQPPYHTLNWHTSCLCFTFDSKTNDYEVLRVATLGQNTDHKFQIYGMRADSWKEIIVRVPNHNFHVHCYPCASLDGVFYWCSYDYSTKERVIDALNTVEGLFKRRSVPGPFSGNNLFLLNDSIALVLPRYVKREGQRFEVWLMDECWTLNYTIGPLLGSDIALGFRPNSEVLLIGCHHNRLIVSYNISTREKKEYRQLCDLPERGFLTEVFPYSESLVSVKRRVDIA